MRHQCVQPQFNDQITNTLTRILTTSRALAQQDHIIENKKGQEKIGGLTQLKVFQLSCAHMNLIPSGHHIKAIVIVLEP